MLRHLRILGVIRFGRAKKGLQGNEGGFKGKDRRPRVFENVEADRAGRGGDVRVVDLRDELHLDGLEGVGLGNHDVLDLGERGPHRG